MSTVQQTSLRTIIINRLQFSPQMMTNLKKHKRDGKGYRKMIPPTTETQRSTGIIYQHLLKAIPHCKTCGHECQGHKRPKGLPVQWQACPDGSCSTAGKLMPCRCSQHNNSGMRDSLLNPSLGFKTDSTGDIKLIILDLHKEVLAIICKEAMLVPL